jgi:ABC-type amino acid transport system permease subunit
MPILLSIVNVVVIFFRTVEVLLNIYHWYLSSVDTYKHVKEFMNMKYLYLFIELQRIFITSMQTP